MMLLLWLQLHQKAPLLDWMGNRDVTRQNWCGRRFPKLTDEASSQTTPYSIQVGQNYIVCTCHMVSWIGLSFCIYSFLFSVRLEGMLLLTVPPTASIACWFLFFLICRHNSASYQNLIHSEVIVRQHQVWHLDQGFNHQWLSPRL